MRLFYFVFIEIGIFSFFKLKNTIYNRSTEILSKSNTKINYRLNKKMAILQGQTSKYSYLLNDISETVKETFKGIYIRFTLDEDEEYWEYEIFKNGQVFDKFSTNPFPNLDYDTKYEWYYDGMDMDAKVEEWKGNPQEIVTLFPKVNLKSIERYYTGKYHKALYWEDEDTWSYDTDNFPNGDHRQFYDFAKKLGLPIRAADR